MRDILVYPHAAMTEVRSMDKAAQESNLAEVSTAMLDDMASEAHDALMSDLYQLGALHSNAVHYLA